MNVIFELSRFKSTLKFVLATVSGLIIAYPNIDFSVIPLLLFTGFSTAFGFVINDISDVEVDKLAGKARNPIVTGKISETTGTLLASYYLLAALLALHFLSSHNQMLGFTVLFLYYTYSFIVRAKAKPFLDVIYHSVCLAIFPLMAYTQYRPVDNTCLLLAGAIFLLSGMSQLLQEVRDYESDRKIIKTTVILLGKRTALTLCLAFFMSAFTAFLISPLYGIVPYELLLLSPLAYFIAAPIFKTIRDETHQDNMIKEIKQKTTLIVGVLLATFLMLKYFNLGLMI